MQDASQAPHSGVSIGAMLSQREINKLAIKSVPYEKNVPYNQCIMQ
ncbi:MAG: hypothetical protein ACJASB_001042 [Shewanella psychromarinicola]